MFHDFLVNPNPPSFPLSLLIPLPIPTEHPTVLWFPIHTTSYWDSHAFLQGTFTDLQEECHYCCDVCSKTFTEQRKLKTHLLIHSEEWPFCCKVCNKSFSWQSSLKIHERIHSGDWPFSCDLCNKSFIRQSLLKAHQRIHSITVLSYTNPNLMKSFRNITRKPTC
jgi:uncharacterized Zn-finger protein